MLFLSRITDFSVVPHYLLVLSGSCGKAYVRLGFGVFFKAGVVVNISDRMCTRKTCGFQVLEEPWNRFFNVLFNFLGDIPDSE